MHESSPLPGTHEEGLIDNKTSTNDTQSPLRSEAPASVLRYVDNADVNLRKDNHRLSFSDERYSNEAPSSLYDDIRSSLPVYVDGGASGGSMDSVKSTSTSSYLKSGSYTPAVESRGSGIAIKSYRHYDVQKQERIRRFEEETRAMLDTNKHRSPPQTLKLDFDKRSIEEAWQKAKNDLEEEDPLDLMADNPSSESQRSSSFSFLI